MGSSIGKVACEALNKQVNEELSSAYMYMAMASVLKDMGLDGCSGWMKLQAKGDCLNAVKVYDHLLERGAKIRLLPVSAPKQDWRAPLHIFEEAVRREQRVTSLVNSIYEAANGEKDFQTQCFISAFITEQIQEEAKVATLMDRLRKMQSTDLGVMIFDSELAKRVQ
jgi:ferritin